MATDQIIRRKDLLLFEEVTFYLIYPFVFEPDNWDVLEDHFKAGIPEERLGWIPTKITKCSFEDHKYSWVNPFQPEETGVKPFDVELEGLDFWGELTKISAQISALLRIRKCGVGTITFEINYKKENNKNRLISLYDLDPFFRLTPRTWTNLLRNKISNSDKSNNTYLTTITSLRYKSKQKSLFSLFESIIKNNAKNAKNAKNANIETNKINSMQFFYSDIDEQIPQYGIYNNEEFHKNIKNNFKIENHLKDTVHPYLYFTGQVEKSLYKRNFLETRSKISIFNHHKNNKKYIKQIAAILFRLYSLKEIIYLTSDYITQELNSCDAKEFKLFSDNLNSKVYTQIYRMASLCFYYIDESIDNKDLPYSVLHPSIKDILENARSKYASLFHSNLVLDLIIYNLNKVSNLAEEDLGSLFRALLKTERLIALSLADPNILLYDGHVAFDAVKSVYDKMNISTLSNHVQEKRTLVSNLLSHANSLKYFDSLNR